VKEEELPDSFDYKPKLYELKSGSSMKYAWDFPSVKDKKVVISISGKTRPVDIKEIGHQVPFRYHKSRRSPGIMAIDVLARGTMQVLRLSDYDQSASMFKLKSSASSSRGSTIVDESIRETFEEVEIDHVINYTFKVNLHGIGVSVINQRLQVRRNRPAFLIIIFRTEHALLHFTGNGICFP
jgi:vacuolar protein sorting-associated protein 13A/C